ncbi:phosphoadenosine phosphosulfate reductase [Streptomyces anulatus]
MTTSPTTPDHPAEVLAPLRSVNFGCGQQSMAMMVLAARGEIDFNTFLFANVGDGSEYPGTLRYFDEHATPYAAEHGLELVMLRRVMVRTGETRDLYDEITRPGSKAQKIPVKLSNGNPGSRSCTADYKIRVIGRELKRRGATVENPATIAIGISLDEIHRANRKSEPHEIITYPLLELGLRRTDCQQIIRDAGLPVPPPSACWFCPNHSVEEWHRLRRGEPELFEKACQLEELMSKRETDQGKGAIHFTNYRRPLRDLVRPGVDLLPLADDDQSDGACDSGYCMT